MVRDSCIRFRKSKTILRNYCMQSVNTSRKIVKIRFKSTFISREVTHVAFWLCGRGRESNDSKVVEVYLITID